MPNKKQLWDAWSKFADGPWYFLYAVGLPIFGVFVGFWIGGAF